MNQFILQLGHNGLWYGIFPMLAKLPIKHGVSTRLGGESRGPYASLNLGLLTGDNGDIVRKNRQRFCQVVGVEFQRVVTAQQVHGDRVAVVSEEDAGKGSLEYSQAIGGTDALVTNSVNLPLLMFFADCVPVMLVDPVQRVIGIAHAGWKGTIAKIAAKTLTTMQQTFGCNLSDCYAAIGPSIGPCCYEVDEAVTVKLQAAFTFWEQLLQPQGDRWRLDLWEANRRQLVAMGMPDQNIAVSRVCTACHRELFFSHRADKGLTGRLGALISLV